ncbi:MAG: SCP2 sterol-binding domain-containing protein [Deltaproteobacteria bacterium]|nr:SCP2 sterol-binding domain-containing protein [Deltaproteobacteria bacterium]
MAIDVKDLFNNKLKSAVESQPDAAKKIGGTYQLNVTGAGNWTIDLASDSPSVNEGTSTSTNCTIDIAEADFQTLAANPQSEGMKLFFAGKLKVKGDQMKAMNLQKLFALAK